MSTNDTEFLAPRDLKEILGFGETKTYEIFRELPTYKIGKQLRVRRQDLDEWLEGCRREPAGKNASGAMEKTPC